MACRSSSDWRPPRRRPCWLSTSRATPVRATSSSTCSGAAAGWPGRPSIGSASAVSIESSPLTRMLAEVVLRPPDVRHLDAAFQGMSASPRGESSLKVVDRRPVRDPLRDVRPDARRRRVHVGGRATIRRGSARADHPPLSVHGVSRPARWVRTAAGTARVGRHRARDRPARRDRRARLGARPFPARRRRPRPRRRAARPAHAAPAARPDRDHRADRGRPAVRAGPGRPAPRVAPRGPAVQSAGDRDRARRLPARLAAGMSASRASRSGASATRGWRSRTASDGPWLRPAPGGRRSRVRCRPASARICGRWGRARPPPSSWSAVRRPCGRCAPIRLSRDPGDRDRPRRASGWSSASLRSARASTASRRPITGRRGRSVGMPPRCCRSMPSPTPRCGHHGRGRPSRSAARSRRSSRRWGGRAESSSWSMAAPRRWRPWPSVAPRPGIASSSPAWPTRTIRDPASSS